METPAGASNFTPIPAAPAAPPPIGKIKKKNFRLIAMLLILFVGIATALFLIGREQILKRFAAPTGWVVLQRTSDGKNIEWQYNCKNCQEAGFVGELDPRNIPTPRQGNRGAATYSPEQGANRYKCPVDPNQPFNSPAPSVRDAWFSTGCQPGVPGYVSVDRNVGAVDYNFCGMQQIDKNGTWYSYWDVRPEVCKPTTPAACPAPSCPATLKIELDFAAGKIKWSGGASGKKYAIRVENRTNGQDGDPCTNTQWLDSQGFNDDVCIQDNEAYQRFTGAPSAMEIAYKFKPGNSYRAWVQVVDSCGISTCVKEATGTVPTTVAVVSPSVSPSVSPAVSPSVSPVVSVAPVTPTNTPTPTPTRTPTPTPTSTPTSTPVPTSAPTVIVQAPQTIVQQPQTIVVQPTQTIIAQRPTTAPVQPTTTPVVPPRSGSAATFLFGLGGLAIVLAMLFL